MTIRCPFAKENEQFYIDYHDQEWGVPLHDDQAHFELLILEGFQAGLSWAIILKRREAFRQAFHQFVPEKVAQLTDDELKALEKNREIIRNKRKIAAARQNGRIFLQIQKEFGSFDAYVWSFVNGKQKINKWTKWSDVPCLSKESESLSKDLKNRGMTFVGPKIIYSYMQAAGLINDHLISCFCYSKRSDLG